MFYSVEAWLAGALPSLAKRPALMRLCWRSAYVVFTAVVAALIPYALAPGPLRLDPECRPQCVQGLRLVRAGARCQGRGQGGR